MTAYEITGIRNTLGLTQAEFGLLLGRNWRSVLRYEAKEIAVPDHIAEIADMLRANHEVARRARESLRKLELLDLADVLEAQR